MAIYSKCAASKLIISSESVFQMFRCLCICVSVYSIDEMLSIATTVDKRKICKLANHAKMHPTHNPFCDIYFVVDAVFFFLLCVLSLPHFSCYFEFLQRIRFRMYVCIVVVVFFFCFCFCELFVGALDCCIPSSW